jgi:CarD family transcriptional regulator
MSDEQFMRDAEKILYDEFAYVLGIKREDILPFILA